MKKIYVYFIAFFALFCSSIECKDVIEESIARLQPEKVREILSHSLLMKAEDKEKYLKQIAALIKEIEQWENNNSFYNLAPASLRIFRQKAILKGMIGAFITGSVLWQAIKSAKTPLNEEQFVLFGSAVICAAFTGLQFRKLSSSCMSVRGLKRVYMIEALLRNIEAADTVA